MTNFNSMLLVKGTVNWTGTKKATFKMIPLTTDCPYIEAIFDPEHLALGIVGKHKKENYDMVPALNSDGDMVPKKRKVKPGEFPYKQEKRLIESWNEHEILTKEEILNFIKMFAVNADNFDVEFFFNPIVENTSPSTSAPTMTATVTDKTGELVN